MSGHGHVTPNADGSKARCGGPGLCVECSREKAQAAIRAALDVPEALRTVRTALHVDEALAWSWHCSIAMAIHDVGMGDPKLANEAASLFMLRHFGVATRQPGATI